MPDRLTGTHEGGGGRRLFTDPIPAQARELKALVDLVAAASVGTMVPTEAMSAYITYYPDRLKFWKTERDVEIDGEATVKGGGTYLCHRVKPNSLSGMLKEGDREWTVVNMVRIGESLEPYEGWLRVK